MKKNFVLILLVICFSAIYSQQFIDGTIATDFIMSREDVGGLKITSEGIINALIVFVQLEDDTHNPTDPDWPFLPLAQQNITNYPDWMGEFIDEQSNPTGVFDDMNLSQYYWEMSEGEFEIIGNIYPNVIHGFSGSSYLPVATNGGLKQLNEDIMAEIDNYVDFSLYDNWTMTEDYQHINQPDGIVDMLFIIYRNATDELFSDDYSHYTSRADLFQGDDTQIYTTGDQNATGTVTIQNDSGIHSREGRSGAEFMKYTHAREMAWYLLGGYTGILPKLAVLGNTQYQWNIPRGMCGWERERLGWITYTELDPTGSIDVTLQDYMTTGQVIKIPTSYEDQYYLIENRQHESIHDQAADTGLYLYLVGETMFNDVRVICADGSWYFTFNGSTITRVEPARNFHKDEINYLHAYQSSYAHCNIPYYHENAASGDDEDAFSLDNNSVFGPWSNPKDMIWNNNYDFSFEITNEQVDGDVEINVNFADPEQHSPFHPMGVDFVVENGEINLSWYKEVYEPDFSYYELYVKYDNGQFGLCGWIYEGEEYIYPNHYSLINNQITGRQISFKLRTVDNSGKVSSFSNVASHYVTEFQSPVTQVFSNDVSIEDGVSIYFVDSDVTLNEGRTMNLGEGSYINFDSESNFIMEEGSCINGSSYSSPEEISVYGTILVGSNTTFNICKLYKNSGIMQISNSIFNDSYIQAENDVRLGISECMFNGANLDAGIDVGIYTANGYSTKISKSSVSGFDIGIKFLNTPGNLRSNYITNNQIWGVLVMDHSVVTIEKNPYSEPWIDDSVIANNGLQEIVFTSDSDVIMSNKRNKIVDNQYEVGTADELLFCCFNGTPSYPINLTNNFWGHVDRNGFAIAPPSTRLQPTNFYEIEPVYDPGTPTDIDLPPEQEKYETASVEKDNGNLAAAGQLYKEVIDEYPQSLYAAASSKELLGTTDDYSELKSYYETEPNLHINGDISFDTNYLANYCDVKMGNLEEAINFYESIITNPPSETDEVFAIVDAGYTYLLMEETGRSNFVGRMQELKPKSTKDFETTCEELFAQLFNQQNNPIPANNQFDLIQHDSYPNPFNPATTIKFSISEDSNIDLSVYNVKGQKVKSLIKNELEGGSHQVTWKGKDSTGKSVTSGIYFYKIEVNGVTKGMKKILLLK